MKSPRKPRATLRKKLSAAKRSMTAWWSVAVPVVVAVVETFKDNLPLLAPYLSGWRMADGGGRLRSIGRQCGLAHAARREGRIVLALLSTALPAVRSLADSWRVWLALWSLPRSQPWPATLTFVAKLSRARG